MRLTQCRKCGRDFMGVGHPVCSACQRGDTTLELPIGAMKKSGYDLIYLSLGAGKQSSALYIMSAIGLFNCPLADYAIFADTMDEPFWVYEHLWNLQQWSLEIGNPIPIHIVSRGHLSQDAVDRFSGARSRFATIPAWTMGADGRAAPLRRQCTREYKIEPIEKHVRELMGYSKGQRVKKTAAAMIGISIDESDRMKPSRTPWVTSLFPLIDARLNRNHCIKIIQDAGLEVPEKSSCRYCPYHSDAYYRMMKVRSPKDFDMACDFDEKIRNGTKAGVLSPAYLHRSMKPLREIDFTDYQMDFFSEECSGVCGV